MNADEGPEVLRSVLDVSRETIERLQRFEALLTRWQRKTNLVGSETLSRFWPHHVGDGAFLFAHAQKQLSVAPDWTDIGAGAGLPGLVIAALSAGEHLSCRIDMVESNAKKCAFQRAAVIELGLRETQVQTLIHPERIETFRPQQHSLLTSRALAPLDTLLDHAKRLGLHQAMFLKGARHLEEIDVARARHEFDVDIIPHPLRPGSALLAVKL